MRDISWAVAALLAVFALECAAANAEAGDRIRERIDQVIEKAKKDALKEALEAEFEIADANEDGSLSVEEFTRYLIKEDHFNPFVKKKKERPAHAGYGAESATQAPAGLRTTIQQSAETMAPAGLDKVNSPQAMTGFWSAVVNSVLMILVTELGDKTFFIAALLAMKNPRIIVYSGAMGALAVMTVLSAIIGSALPALLPKAYTHYGAACLFVYFGVRMVKDGYDLYLSPPTSNEELEEAEEEVNAKFQKKGDDDEIESGRRSPTAQQAALAREVKIAVTAFTMTFLAEWGDRSQIATIAMATTKNALGVTLGGILGHAMCTGLAVVGGRLLAANISEQHVQVSGGILFLLFALHSFVVGPEA